MNPLLSLTHSLTQPKHRVQPQAQPSGFTLTELLVTIIIGGIITSTLLWLIVNLLNTSQRESALSETQRDMQRTLDYIAADMKEAVYVYDGSCHPTQATVCPSYYRGTSLAFLPEFTGIPVLAFWKTDPIDQTVLNGMNCTTMSTSALKSECESLKKRRHSYTLVVYTQDENNDSNVWSGKSRIKRYALEKYSNVAALTRNKGYVDPAEAGSGAFQTWPYSGTTNLQTYCASNCIKGAITVSSNEGTATGSAVTVTDFVDEIPNAAVPDPCAGLSGNYLPTPRNSDGDALSDSFYACVRDVDGSIGQNQDILVFLRGNIDGRGGFAGTDGPLPVLQTQITMRGVIEK